MRRSTSTIKRVQDLLTERKARRSERRASRLSADARAARTEAESRRDGGLAAGRPVPGPPSGVPPSP